MNTCVVLNHSRQLWRYKKNSLTSTIMLRCKALQATQQPKINSGDFIARSETTKIA